MMANLLIALTYSVIVAATGQVLVVVPLLLALTKCGCIKSSFWEDYGLPKVEML